MADALREAGVLEVPVWVVIGTTGEYSGRNEWVVAVYLEKGLAERHADLAMEEERRLLKAREASGVESYVFIYEQDSLAPEHAALLVNRYDPKAQRDYTGTDYHAAESCSLRLELP
jgi:hypothetical protein